MKSKSHELLIWIALAINTILILICLAKFLVWDINYFLVGEETRIIWLADFNTNDYPSLKDSLFSLTWLISCLAIEWLFFKSLNRKN